MNNAFFYLNHLGIKGLFKISVGCALIALRSVAAIGDSKHNSKTLPELHLQRIINHEVMDKTIPGAILGVQIPGSAWVGAAGEADTSDGVPMTPDMQVRLASVTKPFTAVLTMKLVEEGALSLDDTVERWLPGQVPSGDEMTIRMLLNHSAGVADVTENIDFWRTIYGEPEKDWTNEDILSLSIPETPLFVPGTKYSYSNTGYYLLGMIIEAATGRTVSDLFQEKVAASAGLTRTTLTRQGVLEEPYANGYAWLFTTSAVVANKDWNFSWDWTAGSGVSTADDMLRFADALFKGRILEPETVELMISPESFAPNASYGLGLGVVSADDPNNSFGTSLIGWSGANPGTATHWYYMPDYDTVIFVAVNRHDIPEGPEHPPPVNGGSVAYNVLQKCWDAIYKRKPQNDFAGDGLSDFAVFCQETGSWYVLSSDKEIILAWDLEFGSPGAIPVPGDYNGDGRNDFAVFCMNTGLWFVLASDKTTILAWGVEWGLPGAIPVPGDYNGDGRNDFAVFCLDTGLWFVLASDKTTILAWGVEWGLPGSIPVPGDYNGDGRNDFAVFCLDTGLWFVLASDKTTILAWGIEWGLPGAIPVPGDYNGDGKNDFTVFCQNTGLWFVLASDQSTVLVWELQFGWPGAIPVPGDYNGDGRNDFAVFCQNTGLWFVLASDQSTVLAWELQFGWPGALPAGAPIIP